MIKYFGLDLNLYKLPTYTSQIAYELIRTSDDDAKNLNYTDYKVFFYFNDDEIFNVTFDKFVEVVEKNSWDLEQIDNYCIGGKKESFKLEKILLISFGILSAVLIIVVFIMIRIIIRIKKELDYNKKYIEGEGSIKFISSGRTS